MTDAISLPDGATQVCELAPLVRRVIRHRVADPATAEDLTQETLERLVVAARRLDRSALVPYALVSARNVVRGWARRQEREQRHGHRMLDSRQGEDPEERALQDEERRAVAAALQRLPPAERQPLIAHDVEGVETAALAGRLGTTPAAMAVRLSRSRARLRVEYLLALRRVELPTTSCKRVLLAISAGDTRQQRTSGAGEHLVACAECAALSEPLVHRRRPLAALWPFLGLDHLARWLRRTARQHPAPTAVAGLSVGVVAALAIVASLQDAPPRPVLFVQSGSSIPLTGTEPLAPYAEMTVEARGVPVQSVVEPTGFWVGNSPTERSGSTSTTRPTPRLGWFPDSGSASKAGWWRTPLRRSSGRAAVALPSARSWNVRVTTSTWRVGRSRRSARVTAEGTAAVARNAEPPGAL